MIDLLLADLKRDEAFRSKPYDDKTGRELKPGDTLVGKLTVGWGRNLSDNGITDAEAEILLAHDIGNSLADLDRALPWWRGLSPAWQRGLGNMVFNLGLPRLLTFKRMLAALQAGDGALAADEAKDSKWAGQVGDRADRIAALYREE